jgi:hypothetical protein
MATVLNSYTDFDTLFSMFESNSLSLFTKIIKKNTGNRLGFPKHRSAIYGMTKERFSRTVRLSYMSEKHPHIFDELCRIGDAICPFQYTSIQVNRNLVCPPHRDKHNVGQSVLVSFGNYKGCNIVVDGKEYNAYHTPIMFNGSELEHWNTPLESGIKYSLVFYQMKRT